MLRFCDQSRTFKLMPTSFAAKGEPARVTKLLYIKISLGWIEHRISSLNGYFERSHTDWRTVNIMTKLISFKLQVHCCNLLDNISTHKEARIEKKKVSRFTEYGSFEKIPRYRGTYLSRITLRRERSQGRVVINGGIAREEILLRRVIFFLDSTVGVSPCRRRHSRRLSYTRMRSDPGSLSGSQGWPSFVYPLGGLPTPAGERLPYATPTRTCHELYSSIWFLILCLLRGMNRTRAQVIALCLRSMFVTREEWFGDIYDLYAFWREWKKILRYKEKTPGKNTDTRWLYML